MLGIARGTKKGRVEFGRAPNQQSLATAKVGSSLQVKSPEITAEETALTRRCKAVTKKIYSQVSHSIGSNHRNNMRMSCGSPVRQSDTSHIVVFDSINMPCQLGENPLFQQSRQIPSFKVSKRTQNQTKRQMKIFSSSVFFRPNFLNFPRFQVA